MLTVSQSALSNTQAPLVCSWGESVGGTGCNEELEETGCKHRHVHNLFCLYTRLVKCQGTPTHSIPLLLSTV